MKNIFELGGQTAPHFGHNPVWDKLIVSLGYTPRDARQSVAVAAKRNGQTYGTFKVGAFEKSYDGLGYRTLTGHVKPITRTDFITGAV